MTTYAVIERSAAIRVRSTWSGEELSADEKKRPEAFQLPATGARTSRPRVQDALAVRRADTRVVVVALAALARAIERFFIVKHRSRARSTFSSTSVVFSRDTSEISEITRNLARSSMRFSRNDRFLDRARNVRLLSTSTTS